MVERKLIIGNEVIILNALTESLRDKYMAAIIDQDSDQINAIYAESNRGYYRNDKKNA